VLTSDPIQIHHVCFLKEQVTNYGLLIGGLHISKTSNFSFSLQALPIPFLHSGSYSCSVARNNCVVNNPMGFITELCFLNCSTLAESMVSHIFDVLYSLFWSTNYACTDLKIVSVMPPSFRLTINLLTPVIAMCLLLLHLHELMHVALHLKLNY
jgi:hypothetical protein